MVAIGERRSAKAFAGALGPHLRESTEVIGIEDFTGSMAFYLRRPVTVVTPDAEEFTSNYIIRHYDAFAGDPASRVRRPSWLVIRGDAVYVVRNNDRIHARMLESAGLVEVARDQHHVAWARADRMLTNVE